jgi:hypothetical protein
MKGLRGTGTPCVIYGIPVFDPDPWAAARNSSGGLPADEVGVYQAELTRLCADSDGEFDLGCLSLEEYLYLGQKATRAVFSYRAGLAHDREHQRAAARARRGMFRR